MFYPWWFSFGKDGLIIFACFSYFSDVIYHVSYLKTATWKIQIDMSFILYQGWFSDKVTWFIKSKYVKSVVSLPAFFRPLSIASNFEVYLRVCYNRLRMSYWRIRQLWWCSTTIVTARKHWLLVN